MPFVDSNNFDDIMDEYIINNRQNINVAELKIGGKSGRTTLKLLGNSTKENVEEIIIRNFNGNADNSDIEDLPKVNKLILISRDLEFIDEAFFDKTFPNIKQVEVPGFASDPHKELELDFLNSFPAIEIFLMNNHKFSTFAEDFKFNQNLKELNIASNSIKYLPREIFSNSQYLKSLDLSDNQIEKLDYKIFNGNLNLEVLNISNNNITELPERIFWKTKKMKELRIDFNKIKRIPSKLFLRLKDLENVTMKGNEIEEIPKNLFVNTKKLSKVDFRYNYIKFIPPKLFEGKTELTEVNFWDNNIKSLDAIFKDCSKLKNIYFQFNKITKISPEVFHPNFTLSECDCGFRSNPCTKGRANENTDIEKCVENWHKTIAWMKIGEFAVSSQNFLFKRCNNFT